MAFLTNICVKMPIEMYFTVTLVTIGNQHSPTVIPDTNFPYRTDSVDLYAFYLIQIAPVVQKLWEYR